MDIWNGEPERQIQGRRRSDSRIKKLRSMCPASCTCLTSASIPMQPKCRFATRRRRAGRPFKWNVEIHLACFFATARGDSDFLSTKRPRSVIDDVEPGPSDKRPCVRELSRRLFLSWWPSLAC